VSAGGASGRYSGDGVGLTVGADIGGTGFTVGGWAAPLVGDAELGTGTREPPPYPAGPDTVTYEYGGRYSTETR
jgi:hypothetical protein